MTTTVTAKYIAALAPFISTEETRVHLSGLHIAPAPQGGAFLVATNGLNMGVIYDESAVCASPAIFPISKELIAAARKPYLSKTAPHKITFRDGVAIDYLAGEGKFGQVFENLATPCEPIAGNYPAWQQIIPRFGPVLKRASPDIAVDGDLLANFTKAAKILRGPKSTGIISVVGNGNDAALVRIQDRPEFIGVIKPMHKTHVSDWKLPVWLDAAPVADDAAQAA